MKKQSKYRIWIFILIASFAMHACVKNYFELDKLSTDMEWNPNLAIPLINTTLGISDILRDTGSIPFLEIDSTELFSIVYSQKLFSQDAGDFINIIDQIYGNQFLKTDFDAAGGFTNGTVVMQKTNATSDFNVELTQAIDSFIIKSAVMRIRATSTFNHTGTLEITFPRLTKDDTAFKHIINITSSSGSFSYDISISEFEDYLFNISSLGQSLDSILVDYKLTLNNSGSGQVSMNDNATVIIDFTDIKYKFLFGYFGNMDQLFPADSFAIKAFEKISESQAGLADPTFTLIFKNSFGIPMRFGFNRFTTYSNITQTYTNLAGDSIPTFDANATPLYVRVPEYEHGQAITPRISQRTISAVGSNIVEVFETLPSLISFQMGYIFNPIELPSSNNNFIADTSKLDIDFEVEVPLFGYAEYAGLRDTIELDLSGLFGDYAELEYGLIRFEINNGLPVDVLLQGYFIEDLNNQPLDSLFNNSGDQALIDAGELDNNFRVNQETGKTLKYPEIILTKEKMQRIENTKYIVLWFNVRTADYENQTPVKFYSDYTIDLKMGIQIEGQVNF